MPQPTARSLWTSQVAITGAVLQAASACLPGQCGCMAPGDASLPNMSTWLLGCLPAITAVSFCCTVGLQAPYMLRLDLDLRA